MEQETKKCPYCGEEILAVAKKCKYCGKWLKEEEQKTPKRMIPCPICCEMVEEGTEKCPHCNEIIGGNDISLSANSNVSSNAVEKIADDSRSFFDYYLWDPFFRHYVDFKGRLNRKHYWLSICVWLLSLVALLIMFPIGTLVLAPLFVVASIIPFYSTAARRMRDGDSDPGVMGWMSLFFPAIIWWLIKPTEPRMEGMEDAEPDIPQKVRFKKADKIVCLVYVLLLVIGLCISIPSIRSYIAERNAAIEDDRFVDKVTTEETLHNIEKLYIAQLAKREAIDKDAGFSSTYFLHDITGDKIPELWIRSGNGVDNYILSIYTYDNGLKELCNDEEGNEGIFTYYEGKNYILQVAKGKGNGYSGWFKISFKEGALSSEYIYGENLNESGKSDFSEPTEKPIVSFPIDNLLPITSMFEK